MSAVTPTFSTWTHENLAKFAEESYVRIVDQSEQIQDLRLDLKKAALAYYSLMPKESVRKAANNKEKNA